MTDERGAGIPAHPILPRSWFEQEGIDYQEFSAGGVRTFALVEGRRDSVPIVFLHGLPGASFIWKPVIAGLQRKRLAIVPDLPGWGRSVSGFDKGRFEWTPENCAVWLDAVLKAQQVERFDFVGHGIGATVGLHFLSGHRELVRRIALVSPYLSKRPRRAKFGALIASVMRRQRWNDIELERFLILNFDTAAQKDWRPYFRALLVEAITAPGKYRIDFMHRAFDAQLASYREMLSGFKGAKLLVADDDFDDSGLGFDVRLPASGEYSMLQGDGAANRKLIEFLAG